MIHFKIVLIKFYQLKKYVIRFLVFTEPVNILNFHLVKSLDFFLSFP